MTSAPTIDLQQQHSPDTAFLNRATLVWPIYFISQWMKRWKHGLFVFPPKKTLTWRRHHSIGQSCCSMTSKRSIDWFLESFWAWNFFTRTFAWPTKSHARLFPFCKPIKSLYFRSFVVSVLFARFHFKVIRKSLLYHRGTNYHFVLSVQDLTFCVCVFLLH